LRRKIYLVQPTYHDSQGGLLKVKDLFINSLVLPMLSGTIPATWEKAFCLEHFEDVDYGTDASVVAISSMGYDLLHGVEIAREFKRRGKKVLIGGYQAHFGIPKLDGVCDAVVHGNPGPAEMAAILRDAEEDRLAPRYETGLHLNYRFDYSALDGKKIRATPLLMSIGCKNRCAFCCTAARYGGQFKLRKIDLVLQDAREARHRGRRAGFVDSNIYCDREYLLRLGEALARENLGLRWGAEASIDIGDDEEVLRQLHRAGCRILFIGFETPNDESLAWIDKPYRSGQYAAAIRRIHRAGISIAGYFMVGLDGDTAETFDDLARFVHRMRVNLPIVNLLMPAPGTPIYDRLKRQGRLRIENDLDYLKNNVFYAASTSRCLYEPKHLGVEEAERRFVELNCRLGALREVAWRSATLDPEVAAYLAYTNLEFRRDARRLLRAWRARARDASSRCPAA
jgi:radical SAM superfamily enzyme YgiQ (UPF0313 family)